MTSQEVVATLIKAFESLGVPYMLVGSFASSFYGAPRLSLGTDLVVHLDDASVNSLLERLGPGFRLNQPTSSKGSAGPYRYIVESVGLVSWFNLFLLDQDPHEKQSFSRRQRVQTPQGEACLPTAEDVIITKLRWANLTGRTKDRDDARNVIAVQGAALDWDYSYRWCDQHGTRALLEEIRQSIPPI